MAHHFKEVLHCCLSACTFTSQMTATIDACDLLPKPAVALSLGPSTGVRDRGTRVGPRKIAVVVVVATVVAIIIIVIITATATHVSTAVVVIAVMGRVGLLVVAIAGSISLPIMVSLLLLLMLVVVVVLVLLVANALLVAMTLVLVGHTSHVARAVVSESHAHLLGMLLLRRTMLLERATAPSHGLLLSNCSLQIEIGRSR